jgi:hypothetical protein
VKVLNRLQRGLETLYRIETNLDVRHFVVTDNERDKSLGEVGRKAREQLLVSHEGGEVSLGLYLDAAAIANLERHDPGVGLGEHNFGDFCLAVEGVSHFIYVALCAAADRPVTALELELQAEVDKFVSCVLVAGDARGDGGGGRGGEETRKLRALLFDRVTFANDLDADERSRYEAANAHARKYAGALERRYLRQREVGAMLAELRRFYRLPLEGKLSHIARAAA